MEKHSIRLPWLLQVRAMYSTVRHKNTCFGFKKINTFFFSSYNVILEIHKERYPFVNSKSKAACVLHEEDLGLQGDTWQLANNCAGRKPTWHISCATCQSFLSAFRSCIFTLFSFCRLLKSQCGSALFVFGCLLQIRSDCLGTWDCYCADVAILEVPLYNLVNFCYTFAPPPQGEKFGRIKLCSFFF